MVERLATTPFGGAPMSARNFALRAEVERRQERLRTAEGGNQTGTADKWQLIRALIEARESYGLSDRSISVLEALTTFHQERELNGKEAIIVFPSNAELSIRARGMSPATLRRHLAALVEAGFIFRRDSANGKRFCRRDDRGQVENAFGFDLAPLALRAEEIFSRAEAERERAKRIAHVRSEITLHLRDIAKTIEAAMGEGRQGEWLGFMDRLTALSGRVPRNGDLTDLKERCEALVKLRVELETAYLNSLSEQEMSGNESFSEHHIQNSKTDPYLEINGQEDSKEASSSHRNVRDGKPIGISLKDFLDICPQIADYTRNGAKNWADILAAAEVVRSMLGISPSAWTSARHAMGDVPAAIVVAAILERAEDIRSPGGYLRDLTGKAERGRFSIHPMLKALKT
ncbi:replication initiation protein [Rhizobium deserti]|uniref:Replication initiation protein n=1 Tax=Rhizobium deserti TaxID=2547961 RepID=A0A4R5UB69_9HYPH|nr:plasmid replication protein RepC [Rhizobium deserti]TDK32309.1 replication initiation protein [Rhizobium deserti]